MSHTHTPEDNPSGDNQNLNQRLQDLKQVLQDRTHNAGPEVAKLSAQIENTLHQLSRNAKISAEVLRQRANLVRFATDRYAREQPWQVAGIALSLGGLIGFLLARGRK